MMLFTRSPAKAILLKQFENENGFKKGTADFLHTENLVLVDRHGRIRGVYNGSLQLEVDNLIRDIKLLEREG